MNLATTPVNPERIRLAGALGPIAWLGTLAASSFNGAAIDLIAAMYLFALLVVVPLGLSLSMVQEIFGKMGWFRTANRLRFPAAIAATASFWLPKGPAAAALAGVWLLVCGLLAAAAIRIVLLHRKPRLEEFALAASMLFLPVGAFWVVLSRAGGWTMGFEEPIVLLTGVHFHYTGFAGSVLAAMAGPAIGQALPNCRRWYVLTLLAQLAGTPLLAAGFVLSPTLQLIAVVVLVLAISALEVMVLVSSAAVANALARYSLVLSAYSALLGTLLAAIYGIGEYLEIEWISIDQMAATHGVINGFGFVLCGLMGWRLAAGRREPALSCTTSALVEQTR